MGLTSLLPAGGSGLPLTGGTLTGPIVINGGTVTNSTPLLALTQTWNDVNDAFSLFNVAVTNTASKAYSSTWADVSTLFNFEQDGETKLALIGKGSQDYPMLRLGGSDANHALLKANDTSGLIVRLSSGIDMVAMGFHSTQFGITVADNWVGVYKGVIGFNGTSNVMSGGSATADAFFTRLAAAAIQMGLSSATPIDQLFTGPSGVGTNIGGGDLSIGAGKSTGNATPALLRLQGTTAVASGATVQTLTDHLLIGGELVEVETGIVFQLGNEAAAETPTASHTLILKDSTGTSYKVLCVPV